MTRRVWAIVHWDCRLLWRDRTWGLVAMLLGGLLVYASFNGWSARLALADAVQKARSEVETKLATARQALVNAGPSMASRLPAAMPGEQSTTAAAPPHPLAILSVGQADLLPWISEPIHLWSRATTLFGQYEMGNPMNLHAGPMDLVFVVVMIVPLIIIGLLFSLAADERASGVWLLIASSRGSLRGLIVTRAMLRTGIVVALVSGVIMGMVASTTAPLQWDVAARVAIALCAVALYAGLWCGMGLLVLTSGQAAATNAAVLVLVWAWMVLGLPGLLSLSVNTWSPVPSRMAFVNQQRLAERDIADEDQRLLGDFYSTPSEQVSVEDTIRFDAELYRLRQPLHQALLRHADVMEGQRRQASRIREAWQWTSPATVLTALLADLSGTGLRRHRAFVAQAHVYYDAWQHALGPFVLQGRILTPDDYDRLPRFTFQEEPLSEVLMEARGGLAALAIPLAGVWVLAWRRLHRLNERIIRC